MKTTNSASANLSRRSALKKVGSIAVLTTIATPGLPSLIYAGPEPVASEFDLDGSYLQLSQALTGIPSSTLYPPAPPDNTPLQLMYWNLCNLANSTATQHLIDEYRSYRSQGLTDQQIGDQLLKTSGDVIRSDAVGTMARLTMQMWLFGVWFGEAEVTKVPSARTTIKGQWAQNFVVSALAYKSGWIWNIAQAHPMGFSHFNFGSWAEAPPTLADYGIPS